MPFAIYYAGPDPGALEHQIFEQVAERAETTPGSVLYVAPGDTRESEVRERWGDWGSPLQLQVTTFDEFVGDAYEEATYRGKASTMPLQVRYRLVETALAELSDPLNPLAPSQEYPGPGLTTQAEDLLSLLEFAGLLTPGDVEDRLAAAGLPQIAGQLAALTANFHDAREQLVDDPRDRSLRSERYDTVLTTSGALDTVLETVDVAVLGPFTLFSPLEAQLVGAMTDHVSTCAVLPQHNDTPELTGVDSAVWCPHDTYEEYGFERRDVAATGSERAAARHRITRRLYRFDETGDQLASGVADTANLEWRTYPTPDAEIMGVAQDLRHRLTTDAIKPADVAIVTPSPGDYSRELFETCTAHDIPISVEHTSDVLATAFGDLVDTTLDIGTDDTTAPETILAFLENPLVETTEFLSSEALQAFRTAAAHAETNTLETLLPYLDEQEPVEAAHKTIRDHARTFSTASLSELPAAFEAYCDAIGATEAVIDELARPLARREAEARNGIEKTLAALEQTASLTPDVETADAVRRALASATVSVSPARDDAHVTVTSLSAIPEQTFDHVYVVGLTTAQFPGPATRLAFTRRVNEAHPDFAETDTRAHVRLGFATLLTTSTTTILTNPKRSLSGDPFVEADVLAELRRVTGLTPDHHAPGAHQAGTPGAQHRRLARTAARHPDPATAVFDAAASLATQSAEEDLETRVQAGAEAAAARASDHVTPYDGWVGPDVAGQLDPEAAFSPSRLETYAACGFKYYMGDVLALDAPDEWPLDPDARARGGFIHGVLERYYKSFQDHEGQPIEPGDSPRHQAALLDAATTELDRFDGEETVFHGGWLTQVFAGLEPRDENPYPGSPGDKGVLVHFLESEADGKTTGLPAWFEGRVGEPRTDDETVFNSEPVTIGDRAVALSGVVDRIDVVPNTTPTEIVAHDYKTGTPPSVTDTFEGLCFQLPIYLLLAEALLDDVVAVGATYYQVSPPTTASYGRGQIGSTEDAAYAKHGGGALSYWQYPGFDTRAEFREFLTSTVLDRIDDIAAGVEGGVYHPALIDPGKAGCRYCDYREACDVRSHRRRDTIHQLDTTQPGIPAYIPDYARDLADTEATDE